MFDALPAEGDSQVLNEATAALRRVPRSTVLTILVALRAGRARADNVHHVFGEQPDESAYIAALGRDLALGSDRRRQVIAESLGRGQAAELLGITPQAVSRRLDHQTLVGLKEARVWRIPAWQFAPEFEDGVLPGIRELSESFPGGVTSLSRWMQRENADLDDLAPVEAVRRGRLDSVIGLCRNLTSF